MIVDLFKVFQKEILKEKHLHNIQVPSQTRNPLRSTCPQKSDWRQWEPPTTWNYEQNFHPKRSQKLAKKDFCSPIVTSLLSGPRVCRPIVALWVAHWRHEGILDRHPEIVEMYQNWTRIPSDLASEELCWKKMRCKNALGLSWYGKSIKTTEGEIYLTWRFTKIWAMTSRYVSAKEPILPIYWVRFLFCSSNILKIRSG